MTANTREKNLAIWSQVEATDPSRTKTFSRSGGFSGTAINATYQVRRATEVFGPVGIGWGFDEVEHFIAPGANGDQVWFAKVRLWYKHAGERGEIFQWGATTFVGKNKNGQFTDEEAAKKTITDAVGKCLSLLGFSADVYLGLYDDHKYVNDRRQEEARKKKSEERIRQHSERQQTAANGDSSRAPTNGHANGHNDHGLSTTTPSGIAANDPDTKRETSADAEAVYSRAEEAINSAETVTRLNEMRRKIREPQRGLSKDQIGQLDKLIDGRMQNLRQTAA